MEPLPTTDSIEISDQDPRLLFLQDPNDLNREHGNRCSTFLSSSVLLAQGELDMLMPKERNAVITFRDPETAEVKGERI